MILFSFQGDRFTWIFIASVNVNLCNFVGYLRMKFVLCTFCETKKLSPCRISYRFLVHFSFTPTETRIHSNAGKKTFIQAARILFPHFPFSGKKRNKKNKKKTLFPFASMAAFQLEAMHKKRLLFHLTFNVSVSALPLPPCEDSY